MSYRSYTNKTLNNNWYEDRFAPIQDSQKYPDERIVREREDAISCLGAAGIPKALNAWGRQKKWNTTGVIPDDGFREMYPISKTEMPDPAKVKEKFQKPPSIYDPATGATRPLINKTTISSLTHNERELPGPSEGFGAVLPKHPPEWEKRYFETTYRAVHGHSAEPKAREKAGNEDHFTTTNQIYYKPGLNDVNKVAGSSQRAGFMELTSKQKREILSAEILRTSSDPQHNTKLQRTWLPCEDPGVKAREVFGILGSIPDKDNENSLPLGKGDYFKNDVKFESGAYRKLRTEITTAPAEHVRMGFR